MPMRYLGLLLEYFVWTEATLELLLAVSALLRLDDDELGRVVLDLPDPGPGHGAGDPGAGVLSILRLREGIHSFSVYQIPHWSANLTQLFTCIRKCGAKPSSSWLSG